jgi:uncharacterized protein (DUF4415 family)
MKKEYDFSNGKRGPVIKSSTKTRITIYLDDDIIEACRKKADKRGIGYQTLINQALRQHIEQGDRQLENTLRRVVREELERVS